MKKIVLGLTILLSLTSLANSKEDMIEMGLMSRFPILTDDTTTVNVHEFDVDLDHEKIEIKLELKGVGRKEEFEKIDKTKLEAIMSDMAKYAQNESGKNLPVHIEVEVDRDMIPDETLYKKTF
ncbi:MAG: hypothetical protein ACRC7F_07655 [Cetobacterium sp.]|uniref:hypothetical protein n=1 Tax=unclassified Cetobacterium TaxID=2630983 RepID=UPI0006476686|nr:MULTISPECIES: hypothetical protein [unclassified Cetobacterium]